jgi:hypothetical protein
LDSAFTFGRARTHARMFGMSRGPCTFKATDVTKAVKAVTAAGVEVSRVEIDKSGRIVIITGKPGEANGGESANPWDTVLSDDANQKRAS